MSAFIVSGSRRITDYWIVAQAIDNAITKFGVHPTLIIEGGQRTFDKKKLKGLVPVGGVDFHAFVWAQRHKVACRTMPANWDKHGLAAGPIRNQEMAQSGEYLVAIPDPESRGTIDMMEAARKAGFQSRQIYVYYDPELFPEGPTGCLDDGDALSRALRKLDQKRIDQLLSTLK